MLLIAVLSRVAFAALAVMISLKTENGFLVKTKDSFIEISEIEGRLKVGDKLGK